MIVLKQFYLLYPYWCIWILGRMWKSEYNFVESVLSFHFYMYSRGGIKVVLAAVQVFYPLKNLVHPESIDIWFKFTNLTMHFIVLGTEPRSLNVWFKQSTTESHTLPEKVFNITLQRICIHWYQFSIILIIFYVSLQKKNNFQLIQMFLNLKCLKRYWQKMIILQ